MTRRQCIVQILLLLSGAAFSQQVSKHGEADYPARPPQEIWADLMRGNQRFVTGQAKPRDLSALRASLANAQHPDVIVLTCSDSRVSPEVVFDQSLGDLFVVRSAGNIADAIGVGSIEYAVEHLGSTVLVVLGHTKCGAVTAACSGEKIASPNVRSIVDKIQPAVVKARSVKGGDDLIETAIKENVHQSAKDVLASSELLRDFSAKGKLSVFQAEYQLDSGKVILLEGPGS
jgi:carbonic anhydrase